MCKSRYSVMAKSRYSSVKNVCLASVGIYYRHQMKQLTDSLLTISRDFAINGLSSFPSQKEQKTLIWLYLFFFSTVLVTIRFYLW